MGFKGYKVLEAVVDKYGVDIIECVIYEVDKSIENDYSNEILSICEKNKIAIKQRKDASNIQYDYSIAISWRWIIPNVTNLIVLHDSLLPKYRGFAPIVNSLINKEKYLGVTALFASGEYDEGDVILQKKIPIEYPIKILTAIELIAPLYSQIVLNIIEKIKNQSLFSYKQDHKLSSYSLWRDDEDYFINWKDDAKKIRRFIDAVGYPYNGAKSYLNNEIVKIIEAEEIPDVKIENRDIGKVIFLKSRLPVVVCGKGLLLVKEISNLSNENLLPLKKFRSRFK